MSPQLIRQKKGRNGYLIIVFLKRNHLILKHVYSLCMTTFLPSLAGAGSRYSVGYCAFLAKVNPDKPTFVIKTNIFASISRNKSLLPTNKHLEAPDNKPFSMRGSDFVFSPNHAHHTCVHHRPCHIAPTSL